MIDFIFTGGLKIYHKEDQSQEKDLKDGESFQGLVDDIVITISTKGGNFFSP